MNILKQIKSAIAVLTASVLAAAVLGGDNLHSRDTALENRIWQLLVESERQADDDQLDSALASINFADSMVRANSELGGCIAPAVYNSLAYLHFKCGQFESGLTYADSALANWYKCNRSRDSLYAEICCSSGRLLYGLTRYYESINKFEEALDVQGEVLGTDHLEIAATCNNLAAALVEVGKHEKAEVLLVTAVEIWKKQLGPEHPDVGLGLFNIGRIYDDLERYEEAEQYYMEALRVRTKALGPDHSSMGVIYINLGGLQWTFGKGDSAVINFQRALTIFGDSYGERSYYYAMVLSSLADMKSRHYGAYAEAESMYKKALSIFEETVGPNSAVVAGVYRDLGNLYQILGKAEDALQCQLKRSNLCEQTYGSNSYEYARAIASTSAAYSSLEGGTDRGFEEIDSLYREFSRIVDQLDTPNPGDFNDCINHFASALTNRGRHNEALNLLKKLKPTDEGDVGRVYGLVMKGVLESYLDRKSEAIALANEACGILADAKDTPFGEQAYFHGTLAQLYFFTGCFKEALEHYRKSDHYQGEFLRLSFAQASQATKVMLLNNTHNSSFLLNLIGLYDDYEALSFGLERTIADKSYVLDAISDEHEVIQCSGDSSLQHLFREFTDISSRAASLIRVTAQDNESDVSRELVYSLIDERDSLEAHISSLCEDYRTALSTRRCKVADVARQLRGNEVLIEYVRFLSSDTAASDMMLRYHNQYDYGVFVLDSHGSVDFVNLGRASRIDSLINVSRQQISQTGHKIYTPFGKVIEQRLRDVNRQLYSMILAPLKNRLAGKSHLFIAPDKNLYFVPFEILPLDDDRYLLEQYSISYVSSGRTLLGPREDRVDDDGPFVIFSDPDFEYDIYGYGQLDIEVPSPELFFDKRMSFSLFRGADDCVHGDFERLAYASRETDLIESIIEEHSKRPILLYRGVSARESSLKSLSGRPFVLHIATHGFVCNPDTPNRGTRLVLPMLQSGLALTGANAAPGDDSTATFNIVEDGILSAYEASALDLVGTDLVVLSACETGVGEYVNGMGIMGLRSSFHQAGAKSVIMSLWKVPDELSAKTMTGFYERWLAGESKSNALRSTSLAILNDARKQYGNGHPIHWAGFILSDYE